MWEEEMMRSNHDSVFELACIGSLGSGKVLSTCNFSASKVTCSVFRDERRRDV